MTDRPGSVQLVVIASDESATSAPATNSYHVPPAMSQNSDHMSPSSNQSVGLLPDPDLDMNKNSPKKVDQKNDSFPLDDHLDGLLFDAPQDEEIDPAFFAPDQYDEDELGNKVISVEEAAKEKARLKEEAAQKKATDAARPTATLRELFQFCEGFDFIILLLAILGSIAKGASTPLTQLLLGTFLNDLNDGNFRNKIDQICIFYVILSILSGLGGFLSIGGFTYLGERQAKKLRNRYLRAMLRQDISWFDSAPLGDVAARLTAYSLQYQDGVSDKMAVVIANMTGFIVGLIVAFYRGWELTLVILAPAPLLMVVMGIFSMMIGKFTGGELGSYATANSIALSTFDSIRTVVTYGMEPFLLRQYTKYCRVAQQEGKRKLFSLGGGMSFFFFLIFSVYALGLWYGGVLIKRGVRTWPGEVIYTGGAVLSLFQSLMNATMILGATAPNAAAIASAKTALGAIMEIINRKSEINPYFESADNLNKLQITRKAFTGGVSFQKVSFRYPTRPESLVLDQFTYTFEPYSSTALVGPSGCGKTSLMQLIERFYDPTEGNIYVEIDLDQFDRSLEDNASFNPQTYASRYSDIPTSNSCNLHQTFRDSGVVHTNPRTNSDQFPQNTCWVNLKDISISLWRRDCIGLVNQQPVLFSGTIIENLRYGRPEATQEEVEEVAKLCNAHDFIVAKARGYNTNVGENGSLLSGGQKQRLSLARTLMVEKSLVLFDEITAQVDSISERQIQSTLDTLLASRTFSSVSIAHRLSTIRNSDQIVVMQEGKIVETGTHEELVGIGANGVYHGMVTLNNNSKKAISVVSDEAVRLAEEREIDPDQQGSDFEHDGLDDLNEDDQNGQNDQNAQNVASEPENQEDAETHNPTSRTKSRHLDHHDPISSKRFSATVRSSQRDFDSKGNKRSSENLYKKEMSSGNLRRFLKQFFRTSWHFIIPAFIAGGGEGVAFPLFSILMTKVLTAYFLIDKNEMMHRVSRLSTWYVVIAIGCSICAFLRLALLGIPAERLVFWFRTKVYQNLLYQEIGFHDQERNTSSVLTTKLAADTGQARELVIGVIGMSISVLVNIIVSFVIAFTYSWQQTLIMLILFPILSCCGFLQHKFTRGFGSRSKEYIEKAGLIAVEGIRNIRVVASFNAEDLLYRRFAAKQARIVRIGTRSALLAGFAFGLTQALMICSFALAFYFGSWLVRHGHATFEDFLGSYLLIQGCSFMASNRLNQIVVVDKCRAALGDLYQLLDRKSLYDCRNEEGEEHPITNTKIEFQNVQFHYPTAPLLPVLKDVSFTIDPPALLANSPSAFAQTGRQEACVIGIIGNSGGGKSTITTLLPRFYSTIQRGGDEYRLVPKDDTPHTEILAAEKVYREHNTLLEKRLKKRLNLAPRDPSAAGSVFLDGHNIDSFNLSWLRKHIALVSQEPVLFHGTIRENITAGDETLTDEDVVRAAKIAYIHHVIEKLPKKYDTILTSNNSLSGGQKARLCCARALARKDLKIIVFDEFTSALDVKSARIITNNLKIAMHDKVLIFIAHRLETVAKAHKILVLDNGQIAEDGTHAELYAKDGIYANLVRLQQ